MQKTAKAVVWLGLAATPLSVALLGRDTLGVSMGLSLMAYVLADMMIGRVGEMLKAAGRCGKDLNKPSQPVMYSIER